MQLAPKHRMPRGSLSLFWVVPALCACAAVGLGAGLVAANYAFFPGVKGPYLFQGPPSAARSYLGSIVTAMISLTGMVFSLAFVAVQLSSGQYSPRVLQLYLRDRIIRFTFGVFVATFIYALVVQQTVKPDAEVPRVAVTVAFVLVFASAGLFMLYIGRVAYMMRASTIIAEVAHQCRKVIELYYPTGRAQHHDVGQLPAPERLVAAPQPGSVITVKESDLAKEAARAGCVVVLRHRVGDFVPEGATLFAVYGRPDDSDRVVERMWKQVELGTERTMAQDLAFGFRQLIDIIEKALSPSVNDPTTACQALDALHDLLRRLVIREPVSEAVCGPDEVVRLKIPRYQFADLLDSTLRETCRYGSDAAQVPDRVERMLADLADAARPEHQAAVRRWMAVADA